MFLPMILTDKETGRKVHCTIFEFEAVKDGFMTFEDVWELYKNDIVVLIMNGLYTGF